MQTHLRVAASLILASAACSRPVAPGSALVSRTLDATGGTFTVTAAQNATLAGTSLSIPAGALSSPVTITIALSSQRVAPAGTMPAGPVVDFEPSGTTFKLPATVHIPVTLAESATVAQLAVEAVEANGTASRLSVDDVSGGLASFQISGFTRYGGFMPDGDGGMSCTTDADCCPDNATPACACGSAGVCVTDGVGVDGGCGECPDAGTSCSADADCPSGQECCYGGVCAGDCEGVDSGSPCVTCGGACGPCAGAGDAGVPCASEVDCGGLGPACCYEGWCVQNLCDNQSIGSCSTSQDCALGASCLDGGCIEPCSCPDSVLPECASDIDCANGTGCVDYECQPLDGGVSCGPPAGADTKMDAGYGCAPGAFIADTSLGGCTSQQYTMYCTSDWDAGFFPEPANSLGCTTLPIPTPIDVTVLCCPLVCAADGG